MSGFIKLNVTNVTRVFVQQYLIPAHASWDPLNTKLLLGRSYSLISPDICKYFTIACLNADEEYFFDVTREIIADGWIPT